MRFKTSLFIFCGIAASFAIAQAAPIRRIVNKSIPSFTSQAHRFAVWLPTQPTRSKSVTRPAPRGETISMFLLGTAIDPIFYTVIVATHPPSARRLKPDAQLDFARDAMMQSPTTKLQSSERIQLGSFPGRELKLSAASGTETQRIRIYTTSKRLYQIVARGPKARMQKYSAQITKVFDSFRILPQ